MDNVKLLLPHSSTMTTRITDKFDLYLTVHRQCSQITEKPTRCNNNEFIDLQDQLMFRATFCPSSGA